jgi:hypothetical protein
MKGDATGKTGGEAGKGGADAKGGKEAGLKHWVGEPVAEEHPLSTAKTSQWKEFFEDYELWEMIEKDTKRTRAEMDFFQKPTGRAGSDKSRVPHKFVTFGKKTHQNSMFVTENETHNEVLQRILFIYSKLNKGISYVQGMNEIIAPIYFCFSKDPNSAFGEWAEADSFWCFTTLMGEIKDSFVRSLDAADGGIKSRVASVHQLLRRVDDVLWEHFEKHRVEPMFYCMRWVMLFLTQEFELGEVMTLWDSLLSHDNKMEYIDFVCVAIILGKREELLQGEFPDILEALRRIDNVDVLATLRTANEIFEKFSGSSFTLPTATSAKGSGR